jgi:hypothetical protein
MKSVYRGGYVYTDEQFQKMKASHVGKIVSLQGADWSENPWLIRIFVPLFEQKETPKWIRNEKALAAKYNIPIVNFPINAMKPLDELTELYVEWALKQIRESEANFDKTGEYLYLHCSHGADRTGLVIALSRVIDQGWSVEDAYVEWRSYRYNVNLATTWPLDQFFFSYLQRKGYDTRLSNECIRALII